MNNYEIETPDIDSSSDDYARRFSGPVGEWFLKVQMDTTLRMLDDLPSGSLLDVGGGHGQTLSGLLARGYKVTVFDSAEICKKRISKQIESGAAQFKTGNLVSMPFENQSFDIVITYRMMTHLKQWKLFVAELARIAKKCIIIDYPSIRSLNILSDAMFFLKKGIEKNTRTYTLFSKKNILCEFNRNNFSLTKDHPQFFLPMVLYRLLKNAPLSENAEAIFRRLGLTSLFGSPVIARFDRRV